MQSLRRAEGRSNATSQVLPPPIHGIQFLDRVASRQQSSSSAADRPVEVFVGTKLRRSRSRSHDGSERRDSNVDGTDLGDLVFIRCFPLEYLRNDDAARLALERNELVVRKASHPHIIHAYPAFRTESDLFVVEEYCEYGEMYEVVERSNHELQMERMLREAADGGSPSRRGVHASDDSQPRFSPEGLPSAIVVRVMVELMDAVGYLHDVMKICHRDIKLENMLLTRDWSLRLRGFSMSAALAGRGDAASANASRDSRMSSSSAGAKRPDGFLVVPCGSKHYAAPEVVASSPDPPHYDGCAADVWSCGIVLYALVTGSFPLDEPLQETCDFHGAESARIPDRATDRGAVVRWLDRVLPALTSFQLIHDEVVRELITGMLQPNPSNRLSVTAVVQVLKRLRRSKLS